MTDEHRLVYKIAGDEIESILACRRAGIAVKMITGDHPATALAIALEMDIVSRERGDDAVISGVELEAAEIVLADDNFASIERAAEEGRTIYDNPSKSRSSPSTWSDH